MNQSLFKAEIDLEDAGTRLDIFVTNLIPNISRSRVQQLIRDKQSVLVNDIVSKTSYKLKYADKLAIQIPDAEPLDLPAENIPLEICYEDDNMLVVNKPAGMLTHPTSKERTDTLVNALLYYCEGKLSGINGIMRPGILHRLDRDTSGLLMIAKNDYAHKFLAEQLKYKIATRQYLTAVLGNIKDDTGTIDAPIDRHPVHRHKMAVIEKGRHSVTHWRVLERFNRFTYVEATLETGRTHQIRVHMSHIHHPVAGDPLYGGDNINIKLSGQALQAYKLSFYKPNPELPLNISDENLEKTDKIVIEIEPDQEIQKLMRILGQRS